MAKRKQSGFDTVASMPWPLGIALGLIGYIAIRHGIGWYFGLTNNPYLSGMGKFAATGIYAPLAWMLLIGCWIAAIASFIGRRSRRQLLDSQTGIESIRQMSWRQFEQLTGEAFRRQGYAVEETGLGGADGGIDLKLRKNGKTTLVQCKQWRNQRVDVKTVREMLGVLVHERADAVIIVALGNYTPDARRFAHGKPIELIPGDELIVAVRSVQNRTERPAKLINTTFGLCGSMAASLLLIAALSKSATGSAPPAMPPLAFSAGQTTPVTFPTLAPNAPSQPARTNSNSYVREPQDSEELREWKKRNAESMKILEKTTKELPSR